MNSTMSSRAIRGFRRGCAAGAGLRSQHPGAGRIVAKRWDVRKAPVAVSPLREQRKPVSEKIDGRAFIGQCLLDTNNGMILVPPLNRKFTSPPRTRASFGFA